MAEHGDFNSSDFENISDEAFLFHPKKTVGKRISEKILLNQATDRIESERIARNLTVVRGAPGTAYYLSKFF